MSKPEFPHPEIAPNSKFFFEKAGIWYFPLFDSSIKIDYILDHNARHAIGSSAIFYWNKLLHYAVDKNTIADINDDLIECPPIRIITFRILAWERWIDGGASWVRFCEKTHKDALPILEKLDKRKFKSKI